MAGGVNKVILVGNMGMDPEIKVMSSGTKMARLRLATSETYTDRNGDRQTVTEWHTVILWRGLAEVSEKYLRKGGQVYIEGKLRTRSYDDQDGNTKYVTEIVGDSMTMLGGRGENDGGAPAPQASPAQAPRQAPQQTNQQSPQSAQPSSGKADVSPDSGNDESFDDLPF